MRSTWMTWTRPVLLTGSLLAASALSASAQQAMHVAGPEALIAAATATPSFEELARSSSPFHAYAAGESSSAAIETSTDALPDAPSAVAEGESDPGDFPLFGKKQKSNKPQVPAVPSRAGRASSGNRGILADQYEKYIPAGYVTHPQTAHEKVVTGFRDLYSVGSVGGFFISSGWSHWTNSSPNYGTDKGAFGQRLGAAALRSTTQGVLTDIVLAPALHQDLRYYVKGPQYNVLQRSLYATSRVFIARRDTSSTTINTATLLGYLLTAASTQAYYPATNRGFGMMLSSYGTSLGGAVLTNIFNELRPDILMTAHLKKKTYEPFKDNDRSK